MAKRGATSASLVLPSVEEQELVEKLDEIIPHSVWNRLRPQIDQMPWENASSACQNRSPNHEEEATRLYQQLLAEMEEFIKSEGKYSNKRESQLHAASEANRRQMLIDMGKIKRKYGTNNVQFVMAMAQLQQIAYTLESVKATANLNSPSGPSNSLSSDMEEDERLLEAWDQWSPLSNQSNSPPELKMGDLQFNDGQGDTEMEALENLVEATKRDILLYNEVVSEFEQLAVQFLPKAKSPHEKINIDQLEPHRIDQNHLNEIICRRDDQLQGLSLTFDNINRDCSDFLVILKSKICDWRKAEHQSDISIQAETYLDEDMFARFARLLDTLSAWFQKAHAAAGRPHQDVNLLGKLRNQNDSLVEEWKRCFVSLEYDFLKSCTAVSLQPPQTRTVENSKKAQSKTPQEEASGVEKKKKSADKSFGSKKQQAYNTKIRILGGEQFSSLIFTDGRIACVSEIELATIKAEGYDPVTASLTENPLSWSEPTQAEESSMNRVRTAEKEFTDVRISDHSRENSNKNHTDFVRIRYTITVEVNQRPHTFQVLSLPFHFITGSNQLLSCLGTRLWYFGSSEDMYNGTFKVPDELHVETVLDLLNKRMRHVDKNGRDLRQEEKDFLRRLLTTSGNSMVSLNNFVKEPTLPLKKPVHPFYTWFHAVINMIETKWLKPWLDGAIYGLISEDYTKELLTKADRKQRNAPIGTIVLRPGQISLEKPNSQTPGLGLVMQTKCRLTQEQTQTSHVCIKSFTLDPNLIETNGGLYGAVMNVRDKVTRNVLAKFLLAYGKNLQVSFLQQYNEGRCTVDPHYEVEMTEMLRKYVSLPSLPVKNQAIKGSNKKVKKSRVQSKSSGSTSVSSAPESPVLGSVQTMEVDNSPASIIPNSPPIPKLGDQSAGSQQAVKSQSMVTVPLQLLNGGMALKTMSARNSPVPADQHKYETYNNVIIDTSVLRRALEQGMLPMANSGCPDGSASDTAFNSRSPCSGVQTMSPESEPNTMSPGSAVNTMSPFGESNGMSPTGDIQTAPPTTQFHQVSAHSAPAVCSSPVFSVWHVGAEACDVMAGTSGDLQLSSMSSSVPQWSQKSCQDLNLPTILGEAEPQQSPPLQGRRSSRGKQSAPQKSKKHKEKDGRSNTEQVSSQPSSPAQQMYVANQVNSGPQQIEQFAQFDDPGGPDPVAVVAQPNEMSDSQILACVEWALNNGQLAIVNELPFDALDEQEHFAEVFDRPDGQENHKMDSGFEGSPTDQKANFEWNQKS